MAGGLAHDFRERETPNANERKTNYFDKRFAQSVDEGMARWRGALPEKIHKRATLGDDIFIGCSPDSFQNKRGYEAYLKDAIQMFVDKHGEENIVSASIHYDETTPHAHIKLVPIKDNGKISHDHFYGSRAKLAALQTQLYEEVGKKHGLERGVENSRAEHQTIKRYYGLVKKADRLREKGREIDSLEQAQRDRAKVEYTVQKTRKLEDENSRLQIEIDRLTTERDNARGQATYLQKERDQARGEVAQTKEIAKEWATEYWRLTAHVRGAIERKIEVDWQKQINEWAQYSEHRTQMTRLNDEIRREQSRDRGLER